MKRFYLVRHGESEANIAHVHGGPHHPLTSRGLQQAQFIADRCTNLPVTAVFASSMLRAQQTGEAIAQRLGLPLGTCEFAAEVRGPAEFMERHEGDPEVAAGFAMINKSMAPGYRYADEENFDDIMVRTQQTLNFLSAQAEDHVVLVTHGLFLRAIIAQAIFGNTVTPREYLALLWGFRSENTGLTILEHHSDTPEVPWRLFVWNDHAHLG